MEVQETILNIARRCDLVTLGRILSITRGLPPAAKFVAPVKDDPVYVIDSNCVIEVGATSVKMIIPSGEQVSIRRGIVTYIDSNGRVFVHNCAGWHVETAIPTVFAGQTCTRDVLTKVVTTPATSTFTSTKISTYSRQLCANSAEISRAKSALRALSIIIARMSLPS